MLGVEGDVGKGRLPRWGSMLSAAHAICQVLLPRRRSSTCVPRSPLSHTHTYAHKLGPRRLSTTCSKHASAFKGSLHTHKCSLTKTNTARELRDAPALLWVESSLHREQHYALVSTHVWLIYLYKVFSFLYSAHLASHPFHPYPSCPLSWCLQCWHDYFLIKVTSLATGLLCCGFMLRSSLQSLVSGSLTSLDYSSSSTGLPLLQSKSLLTPLFTSWECKRPCLLR